MPFTVFIDESGDSGIAKVRDQNSGGSSPYFVLGAVVAQRASEISAARKLDVFRETITKTKWKHATDLDHSAKVLFARQLSEIHVRYFALISNKATLGIYKEQIASDPQKFYNKCLCYLLEKVCAYLSKFGAHEDDVKVVLEERNHDYDAMLRYLLKVRDNPIYPESLSLRLLNPFGISRRRKGEVAGLEIADFVAHAVYQCANKTASNYGIPEVRYFSELSKRFACNESGLILDTGLKCIHDLKSLELDEDVEALFRAIRAQPPRFP